MPMVAFAALVVVANLPNPRAAKERAVFPSGFATYSLISAIISPMDFQLVTGYKSGDQPRVMNRSRLPTRFNQPQFAFSN